MPVAEACNAKSTLEPLPAISAGQSALLQSDQNPVERVTIAEKGGFR